MSIAHGIILTNGVNAIIEEKNGLQETYSKKQYSIRMIFLML